MGVDLSRTKVDLQVTENDLQSRIQAQQVVTSEDLNTFLNLVYFLLHAYGLYIHCTRSGITVD